MDDNGYVIVDNLETGLAFGTDHEGKPNYEYRIDFNEKIVYNIYTRDKWEYKILKNHYYNSNYESLVKPHHRNPRMEFNNGIACYASDHELLNEENLSPTCNKESSYFKY